MIAYVVKTSLHIQLSVIGSITFITILIWFHNIWLSQRIHKLKYILSSKLVALLSLFFSLASWKYSQLILVVKEHICFLPTKELSSLCFADDTRISHNPTNSVNMSVQITLSLNSKIHSVKTYKYTYQFKGLTLIQLHSMKDPLSQILEILLILTV